MHIYGSCSDDLRRGVRESTEQYLQEGEEYEVASPSKS